MALLWPRRPPGRKSLAVSDKELRRLLDQNAKLQAELDRANVVIEVQKKVSQLLEMHSASTGQASLPRRCALLLIPLNASNRTSSTPIRSTRSNTAATCSLR